MSLNSKQINGIAVDLPLKGPNTLTAIGSLSATQRHRYSYLVRLFNGSTAELVSLIEGRGRNSWAVVNRKINALEQAEYDQQRYFDALYDNFDIHQIYTSSDIIGIVGDVRRDLRLEPYIHRLQANCLNDFFNLYIVHDVMGDEIVNGEKKRKLIGYQPVFRLKLEDQD